MDATLKHSINQRIIEVLDRELAEYSENLEGQKVCIDAIKEYSRIREPAINDKRWESYDLPARFTRDKE